MSHAIALPPSDLRRFAGICGRLASDFDGERAAAALLASDLLRRHGLSWGNVVGTDTRPRDTPAASAGTWKADLAVALRHHPTCGHWEQRFVQSIATQSRLSPKQQVVLAKIAADLRRRGFA